MNKKTKNLNQEILIKKLIDNNEPVQVLPNPDPIRIDENFNGDFSAHSFSNKNLVSEDPGIHSAEENCLKCEPDKTLESRTEIPFETEIQIGNPSTEVKRGKIHSKKMKFMILVVLEEFHCTKCSFYATNKSSLNNHSIEKHSTKDKTLPKNHSSGNPSREQTLNSNEIIPELQKFYLIEKQDNFSEITELSQICNLAETKSENSYLECNALLSSRECPKSFSKNSLNP